MNSYEWIKRVKDELELASDNKAALVIGISRASVSMHKSGKAKTLNDDQCMTVAELLGIDPGIVIADQHMERAKDPEQRKVWEHFLKMAGSAAMIFLFIFQVVSPTPAKAEVRDTVYYVKSVIRKFREWFRYWPSFA